MSVNRQLADIARRGVITVETVADLRAHPLATSPELVFEALGALEAGDGGGGTWRWDAVSEEDDNLGTVVLPTGHTGAGRRNRIIDKDVVSVDWFGCVADGVANDRPQFQAAMQSALALGVNTVIASAKTYGLLNCGLYSNLTYDFLEATLVQAAGVEGTDPGGRDALLCWGSIYDTVPEWGEHIAPGLSAGDPCGHRTYTSGSAGVLNACIDTDVYPAGTSVITCKNTPTVSQGDYGVMFGGFTENPIYTPPDTQPAEFIVVKEVDTTANTITFERPLTRTYFRSGVDFGFISFIPNGWLENVTIKNVKFADSPASMADGKAPLGIFIAIGRNVRFENVRLERTQEEIGIQCRADYETYYKIRKESSENQYQAIIFDQAHGHVVLDSCWLSFGKESSLHFRESATRTIVNNTFMWDEEPVDGNRGIILTNNPSQGDIFSNNRVYNSGITLQTNANDIVNSNNPLGVSIINPITVTGNLFLGKFPSFPINVYANGFRDHTPPVVANNVFIGSTDAATLVAGNHVVLTGNSFDVDLLSGKNFILASSFFDNKNPDEDPVEDWWPSEKAIWANNSGIDDITRRFIPGTERALFLRQSDPGVNQDPDRIGPNSGIMASLLNDSDSTSVWFAQQIHIKHAASYLLELSLRQPDGSAIAGNVRLVTAVYVLSEDGSAWVLAVNDVGIIPIPANNEIQKHRISKVLRLGNNSGLTQSGTLNIQINRVATNADDTFAGSIDLRGITLTQIPCQ